MIIKKSKFDLIRNFSIRNFTLIEVTMALVVVAVGMIGVIAIFPVGFQATRQSIGDNYSSEMADQLLNLIKFQCLQYDGNGQHTDGTSDLDSSGENDFDGWGEWFDDRVGYFDDPDIASIYNNTPPSAPPVDFDTVNIDWRKPAFFDDGSGNDSAGIYTILDSDPALGAAKPIPGYYYLEVKSGTLVEWSGLLYVWRDADPVEFQRWKDTDADSVADAYVVEDATFKEAVKVCLEISWPLVKKYEDRTKRSYGIEIFNPIERKE